MTNGPAQLPDRSAGHMGLLDALLRYRFHVLIALAALMYAVSSLHLQSDSDWTFFAWGGDTLFGAHRDFVRGAEVIPADGRGGLHLYGSYPFLQVGPPAFLLAKLLQIGPRGGIFVAGALIQSLGVLAVWLLAHAVPRADRRSHVTTLLGGAGVVVVWTGLSHTGHLDDALALTAVSAAVLTLTRSRPELAGGLLGLAASCKPWAVVAVALVLTPPIWRARAAAALSALVVLAICWGPFVLADHRTLRLGQVHLVLSPASAAAAFGATSIGDPQTLRLAQFLGGIVVASLIVLLRRWGLAPLAAFGLRLLLEPVPYEYYMASLVVAALLADLHGWKHRLPLTTLSVTAVWAAVSVLPTHTGALLRAGVFTAAILVPLAIAARGRGRPAGRRVEMQ